GAGRAGGANAGPARGDRARVLPGYDAEPDVGSPGCAAGYNQDAGAHGATAPGRHPGRSRGMDRRALSHDEVADDLPAYLLGALDDEGCEAVAAHLATCPVCQRERARLEATI